MPSKKVITFTDKRAYKAELEEARQAQSDAEFQLEIGSEFLKLAITVSRVLPPKTLVALGVHMEALVKEHFKNG